MKYNNGYALPGEYPAAKIAATAAQIYNCGHAYSIPRSELWQEERNSIEKGIDVERFYNNPCPKCQLYIEQYSL